MKKRKYEAISGFNQDEEDSIRKSKRVKERSREVPYSYTDSEKYVDHRD